MIVSEMVRLVLFIDPDLYARLVKAARDAGEDPGDAMRARLAASLGVVR